MSRRSIIKADTRTKVRTRAINATPAQIASFPFDYTDIMVVQSLMLPGKRAVKDVALEVGITEAALRQRLLDPVRCGWMSTKLDQLVDQRLGLVHSAVFQSALATGDERKAAYLDKLYGRGPVEEPRRNLNLNINMDLSALTDEELQQFVKDRARNLGTVIDAEFKETPPK